MAQTELEIPLRLHRFDHAHKALVLHSGERRMLFSSFVRDAEMREHAFNVKAGQPKHFEDAAQAVLKMRVVALKAEAPHAGVELDVNFHLLPQLHRRFGKEPGALAILHGLRHANADDALRLIGRREAEHQDRQRHAVLPQLLSLVDVGYGQIRRADLLQMLRHAHSAVTIGISLHDPEQFDAGPDLSADDLQIMSDVAKVDFGPGPFQGAAHHLYLPFLCRAAWRAAGSFPIFSNNIIFFSFANGRRSFMRR